MLGLILFIVALVSSVGLITTLYRRRPLLTLPAEKPRFLWFPKYLGDYQRDDVEVEKTLQ